MSRTLEPSCSTLPSKFIGNLGQACLNRSTKRVCHELTSKGIPFQRQASLPIQYRGIAIEAGLRLDLVIEDRVIAEFKAIEVLLPIHEAQLLTYMKLSNKRLGFLINFNVPLLKQGIKRIIL